MDQCEECKSHFDTEEMHHDESGSYCEPCQRLIWRQGAIDAGIPISVIDGKTKLSDHFSKEYIDLQCNRGSQNETDS